MIERGDTGRCGAGGGFEGRTRERIEQQVVAGPQQILQGSARHILSGQAEDYAGAFEVVAEFADEGRQVAFSSEPQAGGGGLRTQVAQRSADGCADPRVCVQAEMVAGGEVEVVAGSTAGLRQAVARTVAAFHYAFVRSGEPSGSVGIPAVEASGAAQEIDASDLEERRQRVVES